eukprot:c25213_g1_i1.p1 GENE.c25213_g1_i1~~c25213_g1_i1.p1  ORF type:complete len:283 (+),score=63.02 c25213_g1_i1:126-851(+)
MDGNRIESITPVTIRQIFNAEHHADETFFIDGREVQQVTVVVLITRIMPQETKVLYTVDDGTGMLDVMKWIPTDASEEEKEAQKTRFQEHTWVRVYGALRQFESQTNILAYNIQLVNDFNEITYHMIECISIHKRNTSPAVSVATSQNPVQNINFSPSYARPPPYVGQQPSSNNNLDGFSGLQNMILEAVRPSANEEGVHVNEIFRQCPGFSEAAIREAILELTNEGHVYSTVDEERYKVT